MYRLVVVSLLAGLMGGCVAWQKDAALMRAEGEARMASYQDQALINGILAERTLYPHHFYLDTELLTAHGLRDLEILAAHYRNHPGPLNIRQGHVDDELYAARLARVEEQLGQWGVAVDEMTMTDTSPGGDGILSQRLYEAMEPGEALTPAAPAGIGVAR